MKTLAIYGLIALLAVGTSGCTTYSYRHVLVSVIDANTGRPVEGATVSISFHRRTRIVTGQDGMAMLILRPKEIQTDMFDVDIVNAQYDQHYGTSGSRTDWLTRPEDFIPTTPDIVLKVTSRIEEKRFTDELEAKHKSDEQAAEKLFSDSPDFWPEREGNEVYPFPANNVGSMLLRKRWERASKRMLGSKEDISAIRAAVVQHMKHPQAKVSEIRWISPTVVMVDSGWYSSSLASAGYTYVLRKGDSGWIVLAFYMDYIS